MLFAERWCYGSRRKNTDAIYVNSVVYGRLLLRNFYDEIIFEFFVSCMFVIKRKGLDIWKLHMKKN